MNIQKRINALRSAMAQKGIDIYIINMSHTRYNSTSIKNYIILIFILFLRQIFIIVSM